MAAVVDDLAVIEAQLEALEEGKDFFSDAAQIMGFEGNEGEGNIAFGGKFKITSSDGTITMYRKDDGTPVPVKRSRAAWTLKHKKHLTLQRPNVQVPAGTAYCFLHPAFPQADEVRAAGINRKCKRTVPLATAMDAISHGMYHHKREWAAWRNYLAEKRDETTERRQERLIEATLRSRGEPQGTTSGEGFTLAGSQLTTVSASQLTAAEPELTTCPQCGKTMKPRGLALHIGRFHKKGA